MVVVVVVVAVEVVEFLRKVVLVVESRATFSTAWAAPSGILFFFNGILGRSDFFRWSGRSAFLFFTAAFSGSRSDDLRFVEVEAETFCFLNVSCSFFQLLERVLGSMSLSDHCMMGKKKGGMGGGRTA